MSNRTTLALIGIAFLAGGAVSWQMHNRSQVSRASAAVTASQPAVIPEGPKDGGVAEARETTTSSANAARPVDKKKPSVVADAGSPVHAGETWQYFADAPKFSTA